MTTTLDITSTIAGYVQSDMNRDAIIIALVTDHDVSINKATKLYAEYAKDNGLTAAVVSHKAEALAYLADTYGEDGWGVRAVKDAIIDMMNEYGVAESTARDYAKAYSDKLGMALPVEDPREAIFSWFKANDGTATKEEFMAFAVDTLGRSKSNANEYWKGYELHLALIA